jgi:hypothetical protein
MMEKADPEGRKRSARGASVSLPQGHPFGRWVVGLTGAAGTVHMTPSEQQKWLGARHTVCSATRGSEDLEPNRKSRPEMP